MALFTPSSGIQKLDSSSSHLSVVDGDGPFSNQNHLNDGQQTHDMAYKNDPQHLNIRTYESEADMYVKQYSLYVNQAARANIFAPPC